MVRTRLKFLRLQMEQRQERRLSYRTIAAETGLAQSTIAYLASGRATRVDFKTLATLCQYFQCGIGELLEYVPD